MAKECRILLMVLALSAFASSLLWPTMQATAVEKMSLTEITESAEIIVRVRVSRITHETGTETAMPYSDVHFEVVGDPIKQKVDWDRHLQFPGGKTAQGYDLEVAGMPKLEVEDRAVLFVRRGGMCPLVGWWQGLYRLHDRNGVTVVTNHANRAVTGFKEYEHGLEHVLAAADDGLLNALTYDQFENRVRQLPGV